jgi:hypothetical protein
VEAAPREHPTRGGEEMPRRQGTFGKASWEGWSMPARNHLGSWDHEEQPGYDGDTGGDRDYSKHEDDDAERALVQMIY